jgi:hypothetical protein
LNAHDAVKQGADIFLPCLLQLQHDLPEQHFRLSFRHGY